jgi:hypothetical protein
MADIDVSNHRYVKYDSLHVWVHIYESMYIIYIHFDTLLNGYNLTYECMQVTVY